MQALHELTRFFISGVGIKERCEPEMLILNLKVLDLPVQKRMMKQLTPPTVYADTAWAVYI